MEKVRKQMSLQPAEKPLSCLSVSLVVHHPHGPSDGHNSKLTHLCYSDLQACDHLLQQQMEVSTSKNLDFFSRQVGRPWRTDVV